MLLMNCFNALTSAALTALLFLTGTAGAQIAVYDVTETGVMVVGGFKSNYQLS